MAEQPQPGSIVHVEFHVKEPKKLEAFYGSLFGWKFDTVPGMAYSLFQAPVGPGGGRGDPSPRELAVGHRQLHLRGIGRADRAQGQKGRGRSSSRRRRSRAKVGSRCLKTSRAPAWRSGSPTRLRCKDRCNRGSKPIANERARGRIVGLLKGSRLDGERFIR